MMLGIRVCQNPKYQTQCMYSIVVAAADITRSTSFPFICQSCSRVPFRVLQSHTSISISAKVVDTQTLGGHYEGLPEDDQVLRPLEWFIRRHTRVSEMIGSGTVTANATLILQHYCCCKTYNYLMCEMKIVFKFHLLTSLGCSKIIQGTDLG